MNNLANSPITDLDLSDNLKKVFTDNCIFKLADLLSKSPEELMQIPGLTFSHIAEYKQFIIRDGLQKLQKDF